MKLISFLNDKRTWNAADEGGAGGENATTETTEPAATTEPDAAPTPDPAAAPAAPDYSYLPDDVRGDDGINHDAFRSHYEELTAENARFKDGLASVPENGEYDFTLPDEIDYGELSLPENFTVNLNMEDEAMKPLFGKLGEWMKAHNIPAEASKDISGLLAQYEATKYSQGFAAANAEYERLGPNQSARDARISSVKRAIESKLPAEQAKAIMGAAQSYDGVRALEALFRPSGPGPTVPQNQTSAADLEKMPASQRLKAINEMKK